MSSPPPNPPANALAHFAASFDQPPVWAVSSPGRVNVIGEHVDYSDGCVLPAAINRYVTMVAAPLPGDEIRIRTSYYQGEATIALTALPSREELDADWMRYPLGVLSGFLRSGCRVPGLAVWVESTVPLGCGLSSSAALEVAFATLLEEVTGNRLPPKQKALLCQRAEHEFAGVPCGIMDQFACVLSREDHLLHIDCRSLETRHVPFQDPEVLLLIANTNVTHNLAMSEYAKRKRECDRALHRLGVASWKDLGPEDLDVIKRVLQPVAARRGRHVVTEMERTREAVKATENQAWDHLGQLMYESHTSLAHDFEVSCPELDIIVATAREIGPEGGVLGARMTGGGFGGSTVSLVRRDQAESIMQRYTLAYAEQTKRTLETFITRPVAGAHAHALTTG